MSGEMIRVLYLQAGKRAEIRETEENLKALQQLVGGDIEEYMPFEDDVAIVCNGEGKIRGLPLNRAIRDENDSIQDIIAGDFFICYAPVESESFESLPPEMEEKYRRKFEYPE